MKGMNNFVDDDIYVVLTFISPDQYALLNALGVYIGRDDVLLIQCRDEINQACGRDRSCKSTTRGTKTTVVASPRLDKVVISKLGRSRFNLVKGKKTPWKDPAQ